MLNGDRRRACRTGRGGSEPVAACCSASARTAYVRTAVTVLVDGDTLAGARVTVSRLTDVLGTDAEHLGLKDRQLSFETNIKFDQAAVTLEKRLLERSGDIPAGERAHLVLRLASG